MHNVIIVEDEMLVRLGIKSYIESSKNGFCVAGTFSNGRDALEYCKTNKPDIVLTDITMPIMDGISFIEEARRIYPDLKIIVLSCHDDYKFIKGAFKLGVVDYILKYEMDEIELIKILVKVKDEILRTKINKVYVEQTKIDIFNTKKMILSDLLNLKHSSLIPSEIDSKIKKYCNKLCNKNLIAIMITIDEEYDKDFISIPRTFDSNSALNAIDDILKRYGIGESFYINDYCFLGLITFEREHSEKAIYEKLYFLIENLKKSINEYFNCNVSIAISKKYESLTSTYKAYEEAKNALSYVFYKGQGSIVHYDSNINLCRILDNDYLKNIKQSMIDKSNYSFNKEYLLESIRNYMDYMRIEKITPSDFKHEINSVLYIINIYLIENFNVRLEKVIECNNDISPYKRAEEINYMNVMEAYIKYCVEEVDKKIKNLGKESSLINNIKVFINNHYREEISLQTISDHFHLNRNYFCQYFKKEMNKNFIDYLTEVRIEEAKRLLKSSDISASEVCERVGFNNLSYFIKVFKKVTGISITNYKKS